MRASAVHFRLLLLTGIWLPAGSRKHCRRMNLVEPCGCETVQDLYYYGWGDYKWSQEDEEYFYLDDMAFRRLPPALTLSDSSVKKSDLNPIFWAGGLIYYSIDESFEPSYKDDIRAAMNEVQTSVGEQHLEFRPAFSPSGILCHKSYLLIKKWNQDSCLSQVGGPVGKKFVTNMWLNDNGACPYGTVLHELQHSLGRLHEQNRPDRDKHIILQPKEIYRSQCINFLRINRSGDPTLSMPYDVKSIMHYGSCFFSCTGQFTMLYKDESLIFVNRKYLTDLDILKMRAMYPAHLKVTYKKTPNCSMENGSAKPLPSFARLFLSVTVCVAMDLLTKVYFKAT